MTATAMTETATMTELEIVVVRGIGVVEIGPMTEMRREETGKELFPGNGTGGKKYPIIL